jgi:G3E family GTPase
MKQKAPVPATVLTGFLGAGKTTLLSHILTQNHGYRCALIINEFGAVSIDNQIVVGADEEVVELNNGCLCCRVRGDLIKSLENLFNKAKRFDYLIIETTGLADPSPIAQTFGLPDLRDKVRLDGIVTVIDARHIEKELMDTPEAKPQIGFADVLLLNKTDLVSPEELERIEARIRRINPIAKLHRTERSKVDVGLILNIKAREVLAPLNIPKKSGLTLTSDGPALSADAAHDHVHDESVGSFYFADDRPLDMKKTEAWLSDVLSGFGENIYRSKGVLNVKGSAKRIVFQAVQQMCEAAPDRLWNVGEHKSTQLVFIGKDLDGAKLKEGFESCIAN